MLRYLRCLIGFFAIIAVLPARGEALAQPAPIQAPEGLSIDGTNLQLKTLDPSGRESRAVTPPAGKPGSDVPVKLVFPVETANKTSVVGTYHYDAPV